jgi:hypothetical protein
MRTNRIEVPHYKSNDQLTFYARFGNPVYDDSYSVSAITFNRGELMYRQGRVCRLWAIVNNGVFSSGPEAKRMQKIAYRSMYRFMRVNGWHKLNTTNGLAFLEPIGDSDMINRFLPDATWRINTEKLLDQVYNRQYSESLQDIQSWSWSDMSTEAQQNARIANDFGDTYGTSYVGTCFTLSPSGKYFTAWARGNASDLDIVRDQAFYDALDFVAESHGGWIESGEGDPCDLYYCEQPGDPSTVEELDPDLTLIVDSQDIQAVAESIGKDLSDFGCLFVEILDGDYGSIFGCAGCVPYLYKRVERIQ